MHADKAWLQCRNLRDTLIAQERNPARRFLARVRQVCYEVCTCRHALQ